MKAPIAGLFAVLVLLRCPFTNAIAALAPIDGDSATGVWESIHWESGTFFRLEVDRASATLAVSNGSPPADVVYRSMIIRVRNGALSFSGSEKESGLIVDGSGQGRASGDIGVLKITIRTKNGYTPSWDRVELTFLKRQKTSRLLRLIEAEARTVQLGRVAPIDHGTIPSAPSEPPRNESR
jgi:hypothetical protein